MGDITPTWLQLIIYPGNIIRVSFKLIKIIYWLGLEYHPNDFGMKLVEEFDDIDLRERLIGV